jgi:hypothetical protein
MVASQLFLSIEPIVRLKRVPVILDERDFLVFDKGAVHSILTISHLDQVPVGVANGTVILQAEGLH